MRDSRGWADIL